MENVILSELQELKKLTLLGVKQALTMNDAELFTGLSKSYIYKLVCAKQIPYYKSQGGKLTYFDKDELNSWLLQNRVKTSNELDQDATNYVVTGTQPRKGGKKW